MTKQSELVTNFLPNKSTISILMTSGASCPDIVVESVIRRIVGFYELDEKLDSVIAKWMTE